MSKTRKLFNRENLTDALRSIRVPRVSVNHSTLLHFSIFTLIILLAFTIRLLPLRWGYYLSEFDPYFQYRLTKNFVENGIFSYSTWHDALSWWPWGRDIAHTSYPGLAFTATILYKILNALGVISTPIFATNNPLATDPIYNFVIIFPIIMACLTCVVIYFFGRDIGGKEVGLFATLFLALNASYISRTYLGFFDDETVGIFGILLYSMFFLRSIDREKSKNATILYAIGAGLSLGYLFASWGASKYPVGLTVLFVAVLLLLRRYSTKLLISYSVTFGVALLIAINVPFLGLGFLKEVTNLAVLGMFLLLCVFEVSSHVKTPKMKMLLTSSFVILIGLAIFALYWSGFFTGLETKYQAVLNPFIRFVSNPIESSVQEQMPAAWGQIYYDVGIGIFFIPIGLFFAVRNPTNRNVYLVLFGLTSLYFASSMIRLTLILAPVICLLWALGLTRILRPFITLLRETPIAVRRKTRFGTHVGKEFSAAILIVMLFMLSLTLVLPSRESSSGYPRPFDQAYAPATIASSGLPIRPDQTSPDWLDALTWMRYNLPSDAVVLSWWDYGYWITTVANKTSLADNGTFNWTQIAKIGEIFMSNETRAMQIIEEFNQQAQNLGSSNMITHVVAFFTFDSSGNDAGYGDENKWIWMANIGFNNLSAWRSFGNYSLGRDGVDTSGDGQVDQLVTNVQGLDTLMYKLMLWGKYQRITTIEASEPQYFKLVYYSQKDISTPVTMSGRNALVVVYEIDYSTYKANNP